jgi:hypothetical protein
MILKINIRIYKSAKCDLSMILFMPNSIKDQFQGSSNLTPTKLLPQSQ